MKNNEDKLVGQFGSLQPTYYTYVNGEKYWNCVCSCFHMILVSKKNLVEGKIKSCRYCRKC